MIRAVVARTWRVLVGTALIAAALGVNLAWSIDRAITHIGTTGG